MINHVYQLVSPKTIAVAFKEISLDNKVLIRPNYMAICHADGRYYWGKRDPIALRKKLPMALIHECVGTVLADPTGTFSVGQQVNCIPNVPGDCDDEIFENYGEGSGFLSSGRDGFMREVVALDPSRVVASDGIDPSLAAIMEFVSVAQHAATRFDAVAHSRRKRIAIIGDGSLGFVTACTLSVRFPEAELVIVGHNQDKLSLFNFAHERYLAEDAPANLRFDHAFECTGGNGCEDAYAFVIDHIRPQGTLILMGVSERPVPLYTRDVLEKGMSLLGCSRSGMDDFQAAAQLMRRPEIAKRLKQIIYVDEPVRSIKDIKRVFATDVQTPFKTVFKWEL